jgi:hypothetical protein
MIRVEIGLKYGKLQEVVYSAELKVGEDGVIYFKCLASKKTEEAIQTIA